MAQSPQASGFTPIEFAEVTPKVASVSASASLGWAAQAGTSLLWTSHVLHGASQGHPGSEHAHVSTRTHSQTDPRRPPPWNALVFLPLRQKVFKQMLLQEKKNVVVLWATALLTPDFHKK